MFYRFGIELRDLVTGLLGSLITILVIDQIAERAKLQKTERSITYVKGRIRRVFNGLIQGMEPPKDWQERFKHKVSNWDDFFERVRNCRENTLYSIQTIMDSYHYLMEAELKNDVLEMANFLEGGTWIWGSLSLIASNTTVVINQAINVIKRRKLLHCHDSYTVGWSEGEPPKITRLKDKQIGIKAVAEDQYLTYERLLKESIAFRDECGKRMKVSENSTAKK
jgi:hypothetical protein